MLFAHDTDVSLTTAADLVNTVGPPDLLSTPADLDTFVVAHEFTGSRTHDARELAEVREVRARLEEVWSLARDEAASRVNAMLAEAGALPQLVRHDGWDYHVHAVTPNRPLATRMAVEAAMALVDVIRAGETDRLRRCEAQGCENVLVDLTRNRSRRYCDGTCANREHVAAYRSRRSAG